MSGSEVERRNAIMETVWRYAQAADAGDYEGVSKTFRPDGRLLLSGKTPIEGRENIARTLHEMFLRRRGDADGNFQRHHITTSNLPFDSDTGAAGSIYVLVVTEKGLDHSARYVDRYEPHDGIFLIAQRAIELDWMIPGSRFSEFQSNV